MALELNGDHVGVSSQPVNQGPADVEGLRCSSGEDERSCGAVAEMVLSNGLGVYIRVCVCVCAVCAVCIT